MAKVPAVAEAWTVPELLHGALVIVVSVPPVRMLWLPEAVEVALFCVLVPLSVVLILALPVSLVGVCDAFMPRPKVGVVPAETL
jgi:hypothetical protein